MVRYILTNLGKQKPREDIILKAPPLKVQLNAESATRLSRHCILQGSPTIEDMDPDLQQRSATQLSEMILGESKNWMLWKMEITEGALELCFINRDYASVGKRRKFSRKNFSISIYRIAWYNGLNLRISADTSSGDWDGIASAYSMSFRESIAEDTSSHEKVLVVKYRIADEVRCDVYTAIKS